MCLRCDGLSEDDIERRADMMIKVHGFLIQQVEAERPWTYTIGLTESWAQPELLMVDGDATTQARLLHILGLECERFGSIQSETLDLLDVQLHYVSDGRFAAGLVARWEHRYSMSAAGNDFKEVKFGDKWFGH